MYENNKSFYVDAHTQNYNINRFARKIIRKRWCELIVIKFVAFGVLGNNQEKAKIINTLNTYYPNWRGCFLWYVVFNWHLKI